MMMMMIISSVIENDARVFCLTLSKSRSKLPTGKIFFDNFLMIFSLKNSFKRSYLKYRFPLKTLEDEGQFFKLEIDVPKDGNIALS